MEQTLPVGASTGVMRGMRGIVLGVANSRSIAYAIAEKLGEAGATLVICYQSERLKKAAEDLIAELGQTGRARAIQLDVSSDEQIDAAFAHAVRDAINGRMAEGRAKSLLHGGNCAGELDGPTLGRAVQTGAIAEADLVARRRMEGGGGSAPSAAPSISRASTHA